MANVVHSLRRRTLLLGLAALGLALAGAASAGPGFDHAPGLDHGQLDPTFGALRGRVTTRVGRGGGVVRAVAVRPDGSIIAAGSSSSGSGDEIALAKYTPQGPLAGGFGNGGRVTTSLGPGDDEAEAVAIDSAGRIVVAGWTQGGTGDEVIVVRYTSSGVLDTSFGSGGEVTTSVGSGGDRGYALALQPDGKIVVAGSTADGSGVDFVVLRYTASGALDASFGAGGVVTTSVGPGDDVARAVAVASDGSIVVAGSSSNGSDDDVALARYTSSGVLDGSFGAGGVVTTALGPGDDVGRALVLTKGGIVVAGSSANGSSRVFALARYQADGSLDTSFGSGGVVTTPIGSGDADAFAAGLQGTSLVVAGTSVGANADFTLARYTSDGHPDGTFGNDGVVRQPIGAGDDDAYALAVQSDGRLVVGGSTTDGATTEFAVARFTASGKLDTTLAAGGTVTTSLGSGDDRAYAVAIQRDGRIVVAGSTWTGVHTSVGLERYNPDGTVDASFGAGGTVVTQVGPGDSEADALAVQPDGKLLVAGAASNGSDSDILLARYTSTGSLDPTFGSGGVVTTPVGGGDDRAYALLVQKDGKVVVAGSSAVGATTQLALARYTPTGSLDSTFGSGGIVTTAIGAGAVARAIAVGKGNKLFVAGSASNGADDDVVLASYTASGALDPSFAGGGIVTTPIGPGDDDGFALALFGGKLYVAGSSDSGSAKVFALVRYSAGGKLDPSFGGDGIVTTQLGAGDAAAYALVIQRNGRPIAGGFASNGADDDFALVRYETNGRLNTPFGAGGVVRTPVGAGNDEARALAKQPDGRLIAAGFSSNGADDDVALARYHLCGKPTC